MSVPETLINLVGNCRGLNLLHMDWVPENPICESETTAKIELTARGTFLKIEYDWQFDGKTQEGLILIGNDKDSGFIKAFWIDSWHLSEKFMVSEGQITSNKTVSLKGFYTVPEHPDWGWRTTFETEKENSFRIIMHNVSPEGDETLAVEMEFIR